MEKNNLHKCQIFCAGFYKFYCLLFKSVHEQIRELEHFSKNLNNRHISWIMYLPNSKFRFLRSFQIQ